MIALYQWRVNPACKRTSVYAIAIESWSGTLRRRATGRMKRSDEWPRLKE
jgi:hypothetical protein